MATPLLIPGCKVIAHTVPENRRSWGLNDEKGWYVGPSMQHYQCVQVYFPKIRKVHNVSQLEIISDQIPIPEVKL